MQHRSYYDPKTYRPDSSFLKTFPLALSRIFFHKAVFLPNGLYTGSLAHGSCQRSFSGRRPHGRGNDLCRKPCFFRVPPLIAGYRIASLRSSVPNLCRTNDSGGRRTAAKPGFRGFQGGSSTFHRKEASEVSREITKRRLGVQKSPPRILPLAFLPENCQGTSDIGANRIRSDP